jgi:hypothetical protein
MGMMCTRKGCFVDTSAFVMLHSSRARVRKKRSRLRRHVAADAFPLFRPAILKLISPSPNYTRSRILATPSYTFKKIFLRHRNHNKIQQMATAPSEYNSDAFAVLHPMASRCDCAASCQFITAPPGPFAVNVYPGP